ncbi:MAG: hypothetical protein AAGC96_02770 [Pseudomonadota bacterium]
MRDSNKTAKVVTTTMVAVALLVIAGCSEIVLRENNLINSPEGGRVISAYYDCAMEEAREVANENASASQLANVAVSRCGRQEQDVVSLIQRAFPDSEYYQDEATERARQSAYQLALSWIARGR